MKRHRSLNTGNVVLVQRAAHSIDCIDPRGADRNYFRNQRVVVRRNGVAGIDVRIDSHAPAAWSIIKIDPARRWLKIVVWVFGIDPAFDGMQSRDRVRDVRRHGLAGGDADLLLHKIARVHFFGDRVFHLNAGVHFHEVKVPVLIDQKFNRACIFIPD